MHWKNQYVTPLPIKYKLLGRGRFSFEIYDLGWNVVLGWLRLNVPIESLRVIHFKRGSIKIYSSPHYLMFKELFALRMAKKSQLLRDLLTTEHDWTTFSDRIKPYIKYIKDQHKLSDAKIKDRMVANAMLMEDYLNSQARFVIVCIPSGETQTVIDGFHRLALMAAVNPGISVDVAIVNSNKKLYPWLLRCQQMKAEGSVRYLASRGSRAIKKIIDTIYSLIIY
jgi:hypothetical protein